MGWTNSHLHHFRVGEQLYGDPSLMPENFEELGYEDSTGTKLSDIVPKGGKKLRFAYEYDFGDSWDHEIVVEGACRPRPGVKYPVCVDGKRACPPEDVGGVWGYADFLEAIRNPDHEQHEDMLEWVGGRSTPTRSTRRPPRGGCGGGCRTGGGWNEGNWTEGPEKQKVPEAFTMTESEWQTASEPHAMLEFLQASGRPVTEKLRLFAVACSRRMWGWLDALGRTAVDVAERFADGVAGPEELRAARLACQGAEVRPPGTPPLPTPALPPEMLPVVPRLGLPVMPWPAPRLTNFLPRQSWPETSSATASGIPPLTPRG